MVCEQRTIQNTGRVARAFNVFTNTSEKDETCLPNSAQVARGFTREEEFNMEYLRFKAQLLVNRPIIR